MERMPIPQIIELLTSIYNLEIKNPCLNERYLHHYFTKTIQKEFPIIFDDLHKSKLHPEWATSNQYRLKGGKYKENDNKYEINDNGTSGFIDFALGDYYNPQIGIEFKCNKSWNFQSIVFDYMKLMDKNNLLQQAISFSIIYRDKRLSNELKLNNINETIIELKKRLNTRLATNRQFLFWVVEIAIESKSKRSWYCTNLDEKFLIGIPNEINTSTQHTV